MNDNSEKNSQDQLTFFIHDYDDKVYSPNQFSRICPYLSMSFESIQ